ncbi:hypothetical protein CesoFtcFv8_004481 [Champsocephalus esox]|uniref:Uncharacterized protein n=1 Tax=Champsocephalus esox TaxID=159716 RepID=A0AAN8H8C9_9TELE|nr:hypothetical protein CesoFtcFv8_004481 [Champsocephalus esox]
MPNDSRRDAAARSEGSSLCEAAPGCRPERGRSCEDSTDTEACWEREMGGEHQGPQVCLNWSFFLGIRERSEERSRRINCIQVSKGMHCSLPVSRGGIKAGNVFVNDRSDPSLLVQSFKALPTFAWKMQLGFLAMK